MVITGAASGIGAALAFACAQRGATVIAADIDADGAGRTAASIGSAAIARHLDVTDRSEFADLVGEVVEEHGSLDMLINNAGTALAAPFELTELDRWDRMIDVNLRGVINGTHFAYAPMRRQGSGTIVNVASLGGLVPGPLRSAYCAAKFGVVGATLSLRTEAQRHGIVVTLACPGAVRTPIFERADIVGLDLDETRRRLQTTEMMSPNEAATRILRGAARGRAVVPLDRTVRLFWGVYRASPSLYLKVVSRLTAAQGAQS